jgi:hypothetical protein
MGALEAWNEWWDEDAERHNANGEALLRAGHSLSVVGGATPEEARAGAERPHPGRFDLAANAQARDEHGRFAADEVREGDAGGGVKWKAYRKSMLLPRGKEGPTQFDPAGHRIPSEEGGGRVRVTQRSALVHEEDPVLGSGVHKITQKRGEYTVSQLQGGRPPWADVKDEHEKVPDERERGFKWKTVGKHDRAGVEGWLMHRMGRGEIRKLLGHMDEG